MRCRNCNKGKVCRPRGLCWPCYYAPGVRDRYPSTSKYARRSYGNYFRTGPLPTPTDAAPGSEEKLRVLESRAAAGEQLHSPLDAKVGGSVSWEVPFCVFHCDFAVGIGSGELSLTDGGGSV